ncbi:MAG: glycosyltransferase [Ignavibacteriaceae bacterium]|jgi:glycosyltransferase involved in cell wall biosynthesis
MKVSGFTLVRNGVKYFYPFREAIESILPICDEVIVNVGYSDDSTLQVVESIKSDKIKIIRRTWDMSLREGGKLLSVETNAALNECKGDWCFYIQADEVLHDKYIPPVKAAMEEYLLNKKVEGLRFRYKHFYGSYDYYQDNYRNWYIKEVRVIKNHSDIVSWGDAMDFRHKNTLPVKAVEIDAEIYHYGWVRPPHTLMMKRLDFHKLYHTDEEVEEFSAATTNYDDLGNLKRFSDTHPAVMKERVEMCNWDFDAKLNEQNPDWIRKILIFLYPVIKRLKNLR